MSQLAPLLSPASPATSSSSTEEAALAAALADAEHLRPLLQRLAALSTTTEREVAALQRLELRPLVPDGSVGPGASVSDAELRTRRAVEDKMVQVWEDLQVKGASGTAGVWTEAVRRGRAREAREKGRSTQGSKGGEGAKGAVEAEAEAVAVKKEERRTVDEAPTAPTLETAAIPPPVTLLALPPASPKLGFPLSSIDLPPSSPHSSPVELPLADDAPVQAQKENGTLKAPERDAAHRLPTPPPED